MKSFRRLRVSQVRVTSGVCLAASRTGMGSRVLHVMGRVPGVERALVGFRRGFSSFSEAQRCVQSYGFLEHEHPDAIRRHLSLAERARPSDYAAMFHLQKILPQVTRLIDLGGNVGNLYYSYSRFLTLPPGFVWVVVEIPSVAKAGAEIALERGAKSIRFVASLKEAAAADQGTHTVLLISGALHYFDQPLGQLIHDAGITPSHVLVNRSPVSSRGSLIGIQDGGRYFTTARVLDRAEMLRSMQDEGYLLTDEWTAAELNMRFPLRPRDSVDDYSGFLFSRK